MLFINLEKANGKVPHEMLWRFLKEKKVSVACTRVIKDNYKGVKVHVQISRSGTNDCAVDIVLHQG